MKQCPTCRCITEEEYECHVCHTTITYEPSAYAEERERLVWNEYTRRYLIRKLWFPLLSIAVVAVLIILSLPLEPISAMNPITVNGYTVEVRVHNSNEQYMWLSLFLAVLSLVSAMLERHLVRWMEYKYNREYAAGYASVEKFILGIAAVGSALAIVLSEIM